MTQPLASSSSRMTRARPTAEPAPAAVRLTAEPEALYPASILVVEDSRTQAEWLRAILTEQGYAVRIAPDGRRGAEDALAEPPDMILSDVQMPQIDGFELCRQVKSDPRLRLVPFVMLTQRDRVTDLVHALEVGADNYITKPLEPEVVVERVRRILDTVAASRRRTSTQRHRLSMHSDEMVLAFERTQVVEMLMATAQKLESEVVTFGELGLALTMTHELDALLELLTSRTRELSGANIVAIGLMEPPNGFRFAGIAGASADVREQLLSTYFDGVPELLALLERRQPAHIRLDRRDQPPPLEKLKRITGMASASAYPLFVDASLIGALCLMYDRYVSLPADETRRYSQLANHAAVAVQNARLFEAERAMRRQLEEAYAAEQAAHKNAMFMLAAAVEARDGLTAAHLRRVRAYTELIAGELELSAGQIEEFGYASMLHDVGKLMVPDGILQKPGPLTDEEWVEMRRHPSNGAAILGDMPFFATARDVARGHHERWDGTGYPAGVVGDAIPLAARITSVADIFDALTTKRHYKEAWSDDDALKELQRISGSHLDPAVVDSFVSLWGRGEIHRVRERFSDA